MPAAACSPRRTTSAARACGCARARRCSRACGLPSDGLSAPPSLPGMSALGGAGHRSRRRGAARRSSRARPGSPPPRVISGARLGYRHRARLAVRGRAASPKLGIFQEGTHRIADIPRCGVHHPLVNRVAAAVRRARAGDADRRPTPSARTWARCAASRWWWSAPASAPRSCWWETPRIPPRSRRSRARSSRCSRASSTACGGTGTRHVRTSSSARTGTASAGPRRSASGSAEPTSSSRRAPSVRATSSWRTSSSRRCTPGSRTERRVLELYAGCGPIGLGLLASSREVVFNEVSPAGLAGLALGLAARPEAERARARVIPGEAGAAAARARRDATS